MSKPSHAIPKNASPDHLENVHPHYLGPFVTRLLGTNAQNEVCVVTSRRHRKRLQPLRLDKANHYKSEAVPLKVWFKFWDLSSVSWWLALLFMTGSALFSLGAALSIFPSMLTPWWHLPLVNNSIFFLGSIFFTTAAITQYLEVVNSDIIELAKDKTNGTMKQKHWRWFRWSPRNLGYLASVVQLLGTILFNFNTGDALLSNLTSTEENLAIWTPNMTGSLCFLISTACSYLEVGHRYLCFRPRDFAFWIVVINALGSIAFQISAVASFYEPDGSLLWIPGSNWGTFLGGIGFLFASYLLIPELFEKEGEIVRRKKEGERSTGRDQSH
jgi:hypothetical protein